MNAEKFEDKVVALNDDPAFQQFTEIRKEYEVYAERIVNLERHRSKFRESVFDKVRADYVTHLEGLMAKLQPLLGTMSQRYEAMQEQIRAVSGQVDRILEQCEELELRFLVGEFEEGLYEPQRQDLDNQKSALKTKLDDLTSQAEFLGAIIREYQSESGDRPDGTIVVSVGKAKKMLEQAGPELPSPKNVSPVPARVIADSLSDPDLADEPADVNFDSQTPTEPPKGEEMFAELSEEFGIDEEFSDGELIDSDSDNFLELEAPAQAEPIKNAGDPIVDYEDYLEDVEDLNDSQEDLADEEADELAGFEGELVEAAGLDGAPNADRRVAPLLEIIEGKYKGGPYRVTQERVRIGRGLDNDIQLAFDSSVSRYHAQVLCQGEKFSIVDLNSSNGTLVNGVPIKDKELKDQDIVSIGQTKIRFHVNPDNF